MSACMSLLNKASAPQAIFFPPYGMPMKVFVSDDMNWGFFPTISARFALALMSSKV